MKGRKHPHDGRRGRTEPTVGNLDLVVPPPAAAPDDLFPHDPLPPVQLDPQQRRPPARNSAHRERRRWPLVVALVLFAGVIAILGFNQDRLRGMVPRTQLNDVLTRAEAALRDGHLESGDGQGARELFQAARALEPDNERARDGLHQVGMAELSQADAAFREGRLDEAERILASAREVLGGGSDVDRLAGEISRARSSAVSPGGLIDRAQRARAAGELAGDDGAAALYERVLAADPNNAVAAHGLDKVGAALAAKARSAFAAGDAAAAAATVDQIAALLPNYGDLPELRAMQEQHQKQQNDALAAALARGQEALRAGRVSGRGSDTALAGFKQALAIDPDNAQAHAGLGQVAQALVVQANAALDSDDTDQAKFLLDQAAALAPSSSDLASARARLAAAAESAPATVPAILTPQQSAQVADLVRRAMGAAQRGQIMLPPGESAYDLYRSALAIDGNNAAARQGLQDLPGLVSRQLRQAMADGQLARADELLGELGDLVPGDAGELGMRQRLATAWMDQAERQLDGGDRAAAAQSLQHARRLAPEQTRVQRLAARLQAMR
jgi:tetratricopeptide (TPR) repeat protein